MVKRRVAVIGAGVAGLAAARRVSAHPDLECRVFEQAVDLGGTWRLAEHVGVEPCGMSVHSSMYKNLRTNLPKEIMCFPDAPFPEHPKSYVGAEDVLRYLETFADLYDLRRLISFQHQVRCVRPLSGTKEGWQLKVFDLQTGNTETQIFDAVMVCNGHFSAPDMPTYPGSDIFEGRILHSHDFREPQPFTGQRVLVVGAGPSAMDITMEIATCAKEVILSHHLKERIQTKFPEHVRQVTDVANFTCHGVVLIDGTSLQLDVVVCCTGYVYSFPFLHEDCGVSMGEGGVQPLYKHMVHIERPSLCFLVLLNYVVPFQLADLQARYFVSILDGSMTLPSTAEMRSMTAQELEERREQSLVGSRLAHRMGPLQRAYYDSLANEAGIPGIPPVVSALHAESVRCLVHDLYRYREVVFRITGPETYERIN